MGRLVSRSPEAGIPIHQQYSRELDHADISLFSVRPFSFGKASILLN